MAGGSRQASSQLAVAAVSVRRILLVAPVAVRVRRSPALSLRISPTVIARIASARRAPAAVAIAIGFAYEGLARWTSIVRPALAARSRAAVICLLVNGRLDSISQPDGICFQPWRRRPSRVMNEDGARPVSLLGEPRSSRLSILWTCVTGYSVIVILRVPGMVVFCVPGMTSSSVGTVRSARKSVLGSTVTGLVQRCLSRAGV